MKIINWNCNGAFRNKTHLFDEYDADIFIIQECENPNLSTKKYLAWSDNFIYKGDNKNKGIGIFVKNGIKIAPLYWSDINNENEKLESFLPCLINDEIILIGVWTKKVNSDPFAYIGQFWKYLQLHKDKIKDKKVLIAGDFNSNLLCDKKNRYWNHSDVIRELGELNIVSLYHYLNKEEQGKEETPTFYLYKKIDKPYHLDYIFSHTSMINKKTKTYIENKDYWLKYSDHIPMVCEISLI